MYLFKVVAEFDKRHGSKLSRRIGDEFTVMQTVQIRGDQEKIRSALDRQESISRYIDTVSIVEMLDGSTNGSLKLNDLFTRLSGLVVNNNFEIQ